MSEDPKVVAILTEKPALSSILHMVLSERRELRVRTFESEDTLSLYMHIAPVDLLICDFDPGNEDMANIVPRLREKAALVRPEFQVIALTRTVSASMRAICVGAGIDEVMVKPMSPHYLEERVLVRLREGIRHIASGDYASLGRRRQKMHDMPPHSYQDSNVIPLFGPRFGSGQAL